MNACQRAFTLVELVVVLAVISVLTHLAVRELSHMRDSKLAKAADRQLETLGESVFCLKPGEEATGFLADMGRLPRLADGATLGELWQKPASARLYAVLAAKAENMVHGAEPIADETVYVPTGWRGPYLRLPFGTSRLLDPWGNPIELKDDAGLARLWTSNGFVIAAAHYGSAAQPSGMRKMPFLQNDVSTSRLIVNAVSSDASFAGDVTYAWYGPADGLITGAVKRVTYPSAAVFEGLTPGRRILKAYRTTNGAQSGCSHVIDLKPGDNLVSIQLP